MKHFLRTTLLGGVVFLIPLVVVVLILGKAFSIMKMVAAPVERMLPFDSIGGVGLINIVAIIVMLLCCLAAGMIASSAPAKALYGRLDALLLEVVPGYSWIKTVIAGFGGEREIEGFLPVLVELDDMSQLAFEMERSADGMVVIFFPGAPDPRSGSVAYVEPSRVKPVTAEFLAINRSLRKMGKGSAAFLPPSAARSS